ncbi:hypothetical protein CERSUDRAFT_92434 [Gelatoporia subvermispora B]|uniref:Uncharacterized protein n=1 Tax=Ceriporiopsis subvermispora (strain B) TaxID=914234 RepID=M2RNE8_CERS8|nr:hypothetical protein CERSUDRAFT_92434 [Gelatoporia subvermispora B]
MNCCLIRRHRSVPNKAQLRIARCSIDFSGQLPAQIHRGTVAPAHEGQDEGNPAYEYKLDVDQYSITLVHADLIVGADGIAAQKLRLCEIEKPPTLSSEALVHVLIFSEPALLTASPLTAPVIAMSSWLWGDTPQADSYSSEYGMQSEQANTSLSTDRWMAIQASDLWRYWLCEDRPTVIPGGAADTSALQHAHGPILPTVSEQANAREDDAVAVTALQIMQSVPQYGARTEHSTTLDEPVESAVPSHNPPYQYIQEVPPQLQAHEYRLVAGGLSVVPLHPEQSDDVSVNKALEPLPRLTWLYEVALKYAGSEPPARIRGASKESKKRNGGSRSNPRKKKNENKSGEKGKKCPAKLGELCM